MRLIFMGTPDFAVPSLRALAAAGHDIAAVYSRAPRPAGRGGKLRRAPVHEAADEMGLETRTPRTLRSEAEQAAFAALGAEAAVVVAYGLILPPAILAAPPRGCWNLHASLLPRWRGAAPIQRAIMAGDSETGACVMRMEEGLDAGPTAMCAITAIRADDTAGALADRLAGIGAALLVEAMARLEAGDLPLTPQDEAGATYARKIDKAEARVDWTRPAEEVDRRIRGLSPFPGAWCEIGGERVKLLLSAVERTPRAGAPGEALDDRLLIACGAGAVRLKRLQRAGRAAMDADAFLRGKPVPAGTRLG